MSCCSGYRSTREPPTMASVPSSKRTHAVALAVIVRRAHDERGVASRPETRTRSVPSGSTPRRKYPADTRPRRECDLAEREAEGDALRVASKAAICSS
jgi:hypothetical protein